MYDTYLLIVLTCISVAVIKSGVTAEDAFIIALGIVATIVTVSMIGGELHYRYENRPKHKPRRNNKRRNMPSKVIALIVLEILVGVIVSILYTNGVTVSPTIIVAAILIAAIASLLF